jgi:hypothetical protein
MTTSERKEVVKELLKENQRLTDFTSLIEKEKSKIKGNIIGIKKQQTPAIGLVRKYAASVLYKIPADVIGISNDINKLEAQKIEYNQVLINILEAKKRITVDLEKQIAKTNVALTEEEVLKIGKKMDEDKNVAKMIDADIVNVQLKISKIDRDIITWKNLKQKEMKIIEDKKALDAQFQLDEKKRLVELKEQEKRQQDALNAQLKIQQAELTAKEREDIQREKENYVKQLNKYLSGFTSKNPIISKISEYKVLYDDALKERQKNTVGITGRIFKSIQAQKEMNYKYEIANINSKAYYSAVNLFEKLLKDKQNFIKNHYSKIMNQSSIQKMQDMERNLNIKHKDQLDTLYDVPSGYAPKEEMIKVKRVADLKKYNLREEQRAEQEKEAVDRIAEQERLAEKQRRQLSKEVNIDKLNKMKNVQDDADKRQAVKLAEEEQKQKDQKSQLTIEEKMRESARRDVFPVAKVEKVSIPNPIYTPVKVEKVSIPNPNYTPVKVEKVSIPKPKPELVIMDTINRSSRAAKTSIPNPNPEPKKEYTKEEVDSWSFSKVKSFLREKGYLTTDGLRAPKKGVDPDDVRFAYNAHSRFVYKGEK